MAFAKSTQARHPLFPAHHGSLHDAADFASRCGPASRSTPLRPRPLNRTRRLHYRGPWHLPGPDSHRLAIESLSLGYVINHPSCSWRPSYWTHVNPGLVVSLGVKLEPAIGTALEGLAQVITGPVGQRALSLVQQGG